MKTVLSMIALLATAAALAQAPVAGEVLKVDTATNRITIKHGEIKHLDMPPMSMVFRVRDPKLLQGVAAGDRVKFVAEKVEGNYTVTAIQKGS
jgi:Cu(I)/Ag(I) efflux system periplasmic protein CusF